MLNIRNAQIPNRRSGQAIILISLSVFFLFSVMGLAVDLGLAYTKRQQLQTAADAAAQGAASWASAHSGTCNASNPCSTYTCAAVTPAATSLQAGCLYASTNGFSQGGNGGHQSVSITGGTGNPSGASGLTTSTYWVRAVLTETMPNLFFFSTNRIQTISSDATAAIASGSGYTANCIYVLHQGNVSQTLLINGGLTITGDCGIYVNSSSSTAMVMNGGDTINVASTKIVGSYVNNGGNIITPTPLTGQALTPDPLAGVIAPVVSSTCDYINYTTSSSGTVALSPGVYCGGMTLNGGPYTFNMAPGVYILKGGGINTNGTATFNGTGVMFYNTGNGGIPGNININGSQTLNLSAPSSGAYKGILFFGDRTAAVGSYSINWNGASTGTTGTLYFPNETVTYNGAQQAVFQAIICDKLTFNGNSNLKKDTSGNITGLSGKTTVGLVE